MSHYNSMKRTILLYGNFDYGKRKAVDAEPKSEPEMKPEVQADVKADPEVSPDDIKFDPDAKAEVKSVSTTEPNFEDRYDRSFTTVPQGAVLPPHLWTVENPGNKPADEDKNVKSFECAWVAVYQLYF